MHVLVIGSKGVVGTAVVNNLKERGDCLVTEWDVALSHSHDLRERGALDALLSEERVDFAVFLAFDVGGSKYPVDSAEYISNNLRLMEYTFESLAKYKVPFIHSTSQMSNMDHNPYGVLKRLGEFYTEYLGGINVKIWNVYGPEEVGAKSHVIADFIDQAQKSNCIRMLTTGTEKRQFLHCNDFARAISFIISNFEKCKVLYGTVIDVSSFQWVSILDVARLVAKVCGPNVEVIPGTQQTSFQTKINEPRTNFSSSRWFPTISLEDGIRMLVKTPQPDVSALVNTVLTGKGDSDKHLLTLYGIALSCGAKNILELGVRGGDTTLPLLLAAQATNGILTSVDLNPTEFKCPPELAKYWHFVQSDAIEFLEKKAAPPYDLIYIDDWHAYAHVKKELELIDSMVTPKTVILLHDLMYGNNEPRYHTDLTLKDGQWAEGGPYRAVAELNPQFWEFSTIPSNNGLTILRKKYSSKFYS
jgi:nucleoside-diphosphate-sugar epimerase/predicted O-methyltransferase YrrM